jgi:hypothetical protein
MHMSTGKSPFKVVQELNPKNLVEVVVKIKRDKQNTKAMEFVEKFIKT